MTLTWVFGLAFGLLISVEGGVLSKSRPKRSERCPVNDKDWRLFRDSCYAVRNRRYTFLEATDDCDRFGATISIINDEKEYNFAQNITADLMAAEDVPFWVGATYSSGKFVWLDGTPITFAVWANGEPNSAEGHCLVIGASGKWKANDCSKPRRFVCEMPAEAEITVSTVPPVPSTFSPTPDFTTEPVPPTTLPPTTELIGDPWYMFFSSPLPTTYPPPAEFTTLVGPISYYTSDLPVPDSSPTFEEPESEIGGDFQRTVVLLEKVTYFGQYVFFRGGIDHNRRAGCTGVAQESNCSIPIEVLDVEMPESHAAAYRAWSQGDRFLDWYGPEVEQGTFGGQSAQGTPAVWTTNDQYSKGYHPINKFGSNYWLLDMIMDCSKTENGYFELKAFLGGKWENNISAKQCEGTDPAPFSSTNHVARCGYLNVFHWNEGRCESHAPN